MRCFCILVFLSLISLNVAEPGWFDGLSLTDVGESGDDLFAKAYSQAKTNAESLQKQVKAEGEALEKNLPKFEEGTIASYATKFIGSAKKATSTVISGIRNSATELTRTLIAVAANAGMDLLIAEYKLIAGTTGVGSELALPDIQTSAYGVELKASGGRFSSISSLEKSGKINVEIPDADTILFEIPMRFGEMKVGFDHYEVNAFMFFSTSGRFSIAIGKNNVIIKLRLGMDSTCALSLEQVTIDDLGDIKVEIEGLGSYASMFTEKLTNLLVGYLKSTISRHIQDAVDTNMRKALENNSMICVKFIPIFPSTTKL